MKRSPLRRVSPRQSRRLKEYAKARKEYLAAHPKCEVCGMPAIQIHHKNKRGSNMSKVEFFLAVCRECHWLIHRHPSWAREQGFLV